MDDQNGPGAFGLCSHERKKSEHNPVARRWLPHEAKLVLLFLCHWQARKSAFPTSAAAPRASQCVVHCNKDITSGTTGAAGKPWSPPALVHLVSTRAVQVD